MDAEWLAASLPNVEAWRVSSGVGAANELGGRLRAAVSDARAVLPGEAAPKTPASAKRTSFAPAHRGHLALAEPVDRRAGPRVRGSTALGGDR